MLYKLQQPASGAQTHGWRVSAFSKRLSAGKSDVSPLPPHRNAMSPPDADEIIKLYERHALAWDRSRRGELVLERAWMEGFVALLPAGASVLDMGCGSGQPIARHLLEHGFAVVGVDASPTLISRCRNRFPGAEWFVADMRSLSIPRRFDGLIAWDSFFHLSHEDQRRMFAVFRAHASPGAPLLITTGPRHGEAIGSFEGESLYHASLSPEEYRSLLGSHGFRVVEHVAEDPDCGHHTVWLAQRY